MTALKYINVIPARSGSKGVKYKNIKQFCKKSLLEISLEFASKTSAERIIISTDSNEYIEKVKSFDSYIQYSTKIFFHKRSEFSASDKATDFDVLRDLASTDLLDNINIIAWLRPTSPLRSYQEFDSAINKFFSLGKMCAMLRSVKQASTHPYWMKKPVNKDLLVESFIQSMDENKFPSRQSLPHCFEISSEFDFLNVHEALKQDTFFPIPMYVFETFKMPKVDIDSEKDFKLAEILFSKISEFE